MRALFGVWTLLAALLLSGCGAFDDTPTYRYRMTVEVETPEGLKVGSSVIEVDARFSANPESPASRKINYRVRGEAAAVDLGEGRTLFALLRSETQVDWSSNILFILAPDGRDENGDRFLGTYANMLAMTDPVELPATLEAYNPALDEMKGRPILVTFGDLDDPTSVARVDPDDLAASFGEGVSLKRITVQVTDDPVTTGVEERLGWLEAFGMENGALKPSGSKYLSDATPINLITPNSFSTELYQ